MPTPEPETWDVDPWAGRVKDGYIWGRGAIDDKQVPADPAPTPPSATICHMTLGHDLCRDDGRA